MKRRLLAPLHSSLLPKLRVMKKFPLVMKERPLESRGLRLHSMEKESLSKSVNTFVSLLNAHTPSKDLPIIAIEYMQLELGNTKFFLTL